MITSNTKVMTKQAVDQAAKEYWRLLWSEYGESLVRDVPRRIKAALVANKRLASTEDGLVLPTAHVKSGDDLLVEGMYRDSSSKIMFLAKLDKDCNVKEVKAFDLR